MVEETVPDVVVMDVIYAGDGRYRSLQEELPTRCLILGTHVDDLQ